MGIIKSIIAFVRGVLSEPDGTPSSTRTLMYLFSGFSMWLIWRCFFHIFRLHDPTLVTIWLSNMPMLVTTLIGLIALPYGINKGSSTFSDIANMVANAKKGNLQMSDFKGMFSGNGSADSTAVKPIPPTGTPGVKG